MSYTTYWRSGLMALFLLASPMMAGNASAGALFPPEGEIPQTRTCPEGNKMLTWENGTVKCKNVVANLCPLNHKLEVSAEGILECTCPTYTDQEIACPSGQTGSKILRTETSCAGKVSSSFIYNSCKKCPSTYTDWDWCPTGQEGQINYKVTVNCDGSESYKETSRTCVAVSSFTTAKTETCVVGSYLYGDFSGGIFVQSGSGSKYLCTSSGLVKQ